MDLAKVEYGTLEGAKRHLIGTVLNFDHHGLDMKSIRARILELSRVSFLTLEQEGFTTTTLNKAKVRLQLEALLKLIVTSDNSPQLAKDWLGSQVKEMMTIDINLFWRDAKTGFKRLYASVGEKETKLHLVYIHVRGLEAGLFASFFGIGGGGEVEHAHLEYLHLTALISQGALDRDARDVLNQISQLPPAN